MSTTSNANVSGKTESDSKQRLSSAADTCSNELKSYGRHFVNEPAQDMLSMLRDYAHEKPDIAAMWCFGIGVIVGWKLHP